MPDHATHAAKGPPAHPRLASLRARLLLLVALALAPAFTLVAWLHYEHLLDRQAELDAATRRIAHSRAFEFGEKIADTRSLLAIIAGFPTVKSDPTLARCGEILADMKKELPHYGNLGVARLDGVLACSASPFERDSPPNFADRLWFRRALASRDFAFGEYLVGRVTGRHSLAFSRIVLDDKEMPVAIAFAALDLAWLSGFVSGIPSQQDAALVVLDREGRILARHPDHDAWVGKPHPLAKPILAATASDEEGLLDVLGADGVPRRGSFARVPGSGGELTVYFGLRRDLALAEARGEFTRSLALMAVILLASFALAWFVAERLVLRRARRLTAAAERLAAGDLAARSGIADGDEIGRLASVFDQMAAAVAGREQELARRVAERTAELERANTELAQVNRLKSEFLAGMSHELRTPLNAIIGFSEVLRDGLAGEVSEQQREYLMDIFNGGTHLLALINDILDLSKVEAGKMELDLENLPVASILHGALSIVREKAAAHRLTLSLDVAVDAGELCADPRKVKQIVYNLLSNAVKFTPDGGSVAVSARRVPLAAAPAGAEPPAGTLQFVEIAVADTGIGIAPADQARLFTAFSQIDSSLSRQYEGTGLGLALVKTLAELHGGAVGLESTLGQGSTFRVWLPCRPLPEPPGSREHADRVHQPAGSQVLVVEDDPAAFELLRLTLEQVGFTVTHAADAEYARAALAARMPDLITLDVLLPGEDGWQFLDWLKRNAAYGHIPVVVVSIVADARKGFALGASAVLQKPLLKDDLRGVLADMGFAPPRAARVLVVDDDPLAVERLALLLSAEGHAVGRAGGGGEAVEKALAAPPELILLDLMMPDFSGFDVVQALRADVRTRAVPIVIVTARLLDADERAALNVHVTAVLHKNAFSPEDFLAEVRRALTVEPRNRS